MKQTLLFAALGLAGLGAAAQEVGHVISSVPVLQQVQVPRQVCNQPGPVMAPPTSGGGGLVGALVGGGIGSTIGHGSGNAAAIVAGTLIGAIAGNNVEASNLQAQAAAQSMPQCMTEMTLENRVVGYNVTYDYAGRQSTVQMPYDPGPTVRLQVSPMAQSAPSGNVVVAPPVQGGNPVQSAAVVQQGPAVQQGPMVQQGAVVVPALAPVVYSAYPPPYPPAYPVYPAYGYGYPYRPYFPVGVSLGFVFGGHGGHGGHHR
jgi:uncharacterized protein YcfJ